MLLKYKLTYRCDSNSFPIRLTNIKKFNTTSVGKDLVQQGLKYYWWK